MERLRANQIMQKPLALLGIHRFREELVPFFAQSLQPGFVFDAKLMFELFPQPLRKSRAQSRRRNCDLQRNERLAPVRLRKRKCAPRRLLPSAYALG